MSFTTDIRAIYERIEAIDPIQYAKSRNYSDGAVSYLSPYISRGVVSTKLIAQSLVKRDFKTFQIEKFVQELAWRDYWQLAWQEQDVMEERFPEKEDSISDQIPTAFIEAKTGIDKIDEGIRTLYKTGYMHNHMRMYVAMLFCNVAQCHWKTGAKWMFYHLLDADPASNMLSWQWIAGVNSKKKYYANQDNINQFFYDDQKGSYLDVSYDEIDKIPVPEILKKRQKLDLKSNLEPKQDLNLSLKKTLLYTPYNLDPYWRVENMYNRVLIIDPENLDKFPISDKSLKFILELSDIIPEIQLFIGSFEDLTSSYPDQEFFFKEHPLSRKYRGQMDPRDWLFSYHQYQPSFFKFWNKAKKEMHTW